MMDDFSIFETFMLSRIKRQLLLGKKVWNERKFWYFGRAGNSLDQNDSESDWGTQVQN